MKQIFLVTLVLFALFFNTKTEAQINSNISIGGWQIIYWNNISKAVISQDTTRGWGLNNRGYVEGRGSLRLQITNSDPGPGDPRARVIIRRFFARNFQFPLGLGWSYRVSYYGPRIEGRIIWAEFAPVLYGQSGTRYPYLGWFVGMLGEVDSSDSWMPPILLEMLRGRDSIPTEPMIGMEIAILINAERIDLHFDELTIMEIAPPNNEIIVDSFEGLTVGVEDEPTIPTTNSLFQNYPNPFNPNTTIRFQLSKSDFVTLKVFDVLGREIATLVNEERPVGEHSIPFNGLNLPSGMYFYNLNIGHGQFVQTKKMILMK